MKEGWFLPNFSFILFRDNNLSERIGIEFAQLPLNQLSNISGMNLIHLKKTNNSYIAKAQDERKVLGISLFNRVYDFILSPGENHWRYTKSRKKVNNYHQKHLKHWLSDHKRFIEKKEV